MSGHLAEVWFDSIAIRSAQSYCLRCRSERQTETTRTRRKQIRQNPDEVEYAKRVVTHHQEIAHAVRL
jgi:hypothetical protein